MSSPQYTTAPHDPTGSEMPHDHGADEKEFDLYKCLEDAANSKSLLPLVVTVVLFLAFLNEALGALQERMKAKPLFWFRSRRVTLTLHHVTSTGVHVTRMALMLTLMLVFMTLNPWLCGSVLVGAAVGHLVFSWRAEWDSESRDKEDQSGRPLW